MIYLYHYPPQISFHPNNLIHICIKEKKNQLLTENNTYWYYKINYLIKKELLRFENIFDNFFYLENMNLYDIFFGI